MKEETKRTGKHSSQEYFNPRSAGTTHSSAIKDILSVIAKQEHGSRADVANPLLRSARASAGARDISRLSQLQGEPATCWFALVVLTRTQAVSRCSRQSVFHLYSVYSIRHTMARSPLRTKDSGCTSALPRGTPPAAQTGRNATTSHSAKVQRKRHFGLLSHKLEKKQG